MAKARTSWWADALRGAIAGACATWLMDLVTTGVAAGQSEESKRRESAARPNGRSTVANLVDRLGSATGVEIPGDQRPFVSELVHYGLGVVPGAAYGVLRSRVPLVGACRGVAYGALLWAANDEYLNTRLGLAGPLDAYPLETHWRGLVGHVVLGAATDSAIDILGGQTGTVIRT